MTHNFAEDLPTWTPRARNERSEVPLWMTIPMLIALYGSIYGFGLMTGWLLWG